MEHSQSPRPTMLPQTAELAALKADAERVVADYHATIVAQSTMSHDDFIAWYNAQAAQRRERMGRDYWDRRLDRAPLVAACPRHPLG